MSRLVSIALIVLLMINYGHTHMPMLLQAPEFDDGGLIPSRYTCDGENVSPELQWLFPPKGTKSFALIVSDPDAPRGTWYHWIVYNIPTYVTVLPSNVALGPPVRVGQSSWPLRRFYSGPCPPAGRRHTYEFTLFALNGTLREPELDAHGLLAHVSQLALGAASVSGRYARHHSASDSAGSEQQQQPLVGNVATNERLGKLRVFKESLADSSSSRGSYCSSDDAIPASEHGISRVHIIVTGTVNNVYFGQYAAMTALDVGVTGWVRDKPTPNAPASEGRIELVAEGKYSQLCQIIRFCYLGSPRAHVSDVDVTWQEAKGGMSSFHRLEKKRNARDNSNATATTIIH